MHKITTLFTILLFSVQLFAQDDEMPGSVDDVINWNFSVTYDGDEAVLNMTVDQKDHWHVYTQKQPEGSVAFPTEFNFTPNDHYELVGSVKEYGAEEHNNDGFPEKYFPGDKAKFKQRIKIKSKSKFKIELEYGFMACKTACFAPQFRSYTFEVDGSKAKGTSQNENENGNGNGNGDENENGDEEKGDDQSENIDSYADSTLALLASTCEGFTYTDKLTPVRVLVPEAVRTDKKDYSLSVEIQIDSIFAMYAFKNPEARESIFKIVETENVKADGDYTTTINKIVEKKIKGYKYNVRIQQNITLKDTTKASNVNGFLDIYLMGCENDFHNKEKVEFSYNLKQALDNKTRTEKDSLWLIFALAFVGGLLALFTPCVFPMIPMTVSFFTKQSKTRAEGIRKATFYALCIIGIYVILGVLVSSIAGEDALNAMATNPWVNIVFFLLFVVFAISFFGAFEITLPNSWVNKADKQADKGGYVGIFFMAFTLALVSFSCTGPIVGSVLVQSAQGGLTGPIIAMLGFSSALALPFGLFAAFPGWLNSLPQSGGWLNAVKVVLGFLELAFALKFLSNADLVMQWHFLERELFLAIWIGIFVMLFIYLLGKIQFPHDSPMQNLSVGRGMLALIVLGFTIYLIPGMWGAPLKLISGFPPPRTYSEAPYGFHGEAPTVDNDWPESTHAHGHGINTIRDYNDALEFAKKVDKPLLLDFTGWACVNCRKMEEYVWADETVAPIMAEDFVIASLYVDDRGALPEKYKGEKKANGDPMTTIGDKWMKMQIQRYQEVTQPMYVILDHNENNISGKANYQSHGNVQAFRDWLEFGKKQFEMSKDAQTYIPEFEIVK